MLVDILSILVFQVSKSLVRLAFEFGDEFVLLDNLELESLVG